MKAFANGFNSYNSIYAYIVGGFSGIGNCYEWRLCVCASLEEAINFINEKFFEDKISEENFSVRHKFSVTHNATNETFKTFVLKNSPQKKLECLKNGYDEDEEDEKFKFNELYIQIDTKNYIQLENGEICNLSKSYKFDEFSCE